VRIFSSTKEIREKEVCGGSLYGKRRETGKERPGGFIIFGKG